MILKGIKPKILVVMVLGFVKSAKSLKNIGVMSKTKKVTITLSPEQQEKAREMSKKLFGRENISGFVAYLIEHYGTKKAT